MQDITTTHQIKSRMSDILNRFPMPSVLQIANAITGIKILPLQVA